MVGFAPAGDNTNYGLSGGRGGGHSDMFQTAVYSLTRVGAAYVSAALAHSWNQVSIDRIPTVAGLDNVDCDLYSADLFVLGTLDRFFRPGTIIVFDDFYSMGEEFKAFFDYNRSFGREWAALGRMPHCVKTAIEMRS